MKAVQIPLIALCSLSFSYSAEIEKSLAAAKNPIRLSEISFVAEAYKDEKSAIDDLSSILLKSHISTTDKAAKIFDEIVKEFDQHLKETPLGQMLVKPKPQEVLDMIEKGMIELGKKLVTYAEEKANYFVEKEFITREKAISLLRKAMREGYDNPRGLGFRWFANGYASQLGSGGQSYSFGCRFSQCLTERYFELSVISRPII